MHQLWLLLALVPLGWALRGYPNTYDYCVVGAGPGGLQIGYFLHRSWRDYIIFERSSGPGSFFKSYPRHRTLISINKRYTGNTNAEFNFRHDWNSLISHDKSLLFTNYSTKLFPAADDYLRYLGDYQRKLNLTVQYNTTVSDINRVNEIFRDNNETIFIMKDQNGKKYQCRYVIVANGISEPIVPNIAGINYTEGYETVSVDPKDFEGQTVLILGRGNSAFETAHNIYSETNYIHMVARSRVRLSWSTHYVGDLRAVNNALLDTYQLKSLDAVLEAAIEDVSFEKIDNKLYVVPPNVDDSGDDNDNFAMREPYDRIIRCLGFKFDSSLFHKDLGYKPLVGRRIEKYPSILPSYESTHIPGLFFAGTNTHSIDFRQSAGGFIHGFRYTAQALHRYLEVRNHKERWPSFKLSSAMLLNTILKRINEASGNYQMFSVLGDVFLFSEDKATFQHLEEFPIRCIDKLQEMTGHMVEGEVLIWLYEYGANFSGPGKDVFRLDRAIGEPAYAHESNFLHPVLYHYKTLPTEKDMKDLPPKHVLPRPVAIYHIIEDFLTLWTAPLSHILPLRRFIESVASQDLRDFNDETCFMDAMTKHTNSLSCMQHYMSGNGVSVQQVPSSLQTNCFSQSAC